MTCHAYADFVRPSVDHAAGYAGFGFAGLSLFAHDFASVFEGAALEGLSGTARGGAGDRPEAAVAVGDLGAATGGGLQRGGWFVVAGCEGEDEEERISAESHKTTS